MKKVGKYLGVTFAGLLSLGALLLWDDFTSKVVVHNLTSDDLTEVEIGVGSEGEANLREVFWRGTIRRGQIQYSGKVADREGGITVRFKRAGKADALHYGYVSGALVPMRIRVCVGEAGVETKIIPPFLGRFSLAISPYADEPGRCHGS